ncbi:MAG: diaminopimelate epimerase [Gammaproteobacteria bacterium]|nr:diaminopimelate epimerase [Gammaproteobacteria bacterium]
MQIRFTKMEGAGNDFVVIDASTAPLDLDASECRRLADRRYGVGCDQVLVILPARDSKEDFSYRIYNADGGEVEQCGNGVRCVAQYIRDHGLSSKPLLKLGSLGGVMRAELLGEEGVRVDMGEPVLEPADIPFDAETRQVLYPVELEGESFELGAISMGNPHAVVRVYDLDATPVEDLGEMLEAHPRFPNRVNVGFLEILDTRHIRLRVYERGVGETLACGTGACAAVVWGNLAGLLDDTVAVDLPGGTLVISWKGEGQPVLMTGPANTVFTGEIEL